MESPIIFIHYGASEYMRYTLDSARYFNSHKRVILLGDDASKHMCHVLNIEHFQLAEIPITPELAHFDRVYKNISNPSVGRPEWLNFIVRRWFLMHSFCQNNGIDSFWTFDSDTLIFQNLSNHEIKFKDYAGTSQCNGKCLNGFITSQDIVKKYLDKCLSLYESEEYINECVKYSEDIPNYFLNEMALFEQMLIHDQPNIIRLNSIINGQTFDDCLCQLHDMTPSQFGTKLIVLFQGKFYFHHVPSQSLVEVISINMSWIQTEWVAKLFFVALDYFGRSNEPKEAVSIAVPGPAHCLDNLK